MATLDQACRTPPDAMLSPVTDEDVPAVVLLMNEAYRGAGPSAGWSTEADYLGGDRTTESILREDLLANPDAVFLKWAAPPGDRLLGCVWLEPLGGGTWYLGSLATAPERQNTGLGRTLLAAAERWASQRGGTRIEMTVVNVRDALIAWYLRRGYRDTGETAPFPYDDDRFGTPLRDDLSFVVLEKDLAPPPPIRAPAWLPAPAASRRRRRFPPTAPG